MADFKMIPPSAADIREAYETVRELEHVATQSQMIRWTSSGCEKTGETISQSDRLVVIAAGLGRVSRLLQTRCFFPEELAKALSE